MRQTYEIYPRQVMEVDSRVGQTGSRDPRAKMHMVSCMEEILYDSSEIYVLLFPKQRGGGNSRVESTGSVISLTPSHSLSPKMSTKQNIILSLHFTSIFLFLSFFLPSFLLPSSLSFFLLPLPAPPTTTTTTSQNKTKHIQNNSRRPHKQQPRVLAPRTARMHFRFLGLWQRVRHRGAGGEISGRRQRMVGVEGEVFHDCGCLFFRGWLSIS